MNSSWHCGSFSLVHKESSRRSVQACCVIALLCNSLELSRLTESGRKQIPSPSLLLGSCILLFPKEDTKITAVSYSECL